MRPSDFISLLAGKVLLQDRFATRANRVAGRFSLPAPTQPRVRVRTGRFPIAEQHRSIKPSTSTLTLDCSKAR